MTENYEYYLCEHNKNKLFKCFSEERPVADILISTAHISFTKQM